MIVGGVDSASIYVSWQKPEGMMNGITLYKALAREASRAVEQTQEHFCFADASLEELGCSISGLSPSTTY
uniref:Fibronectin type-III domain-containing protein n=1 Tax=Mesocestoides corti TaxID=53468 RepID=A0A5K3G1I3_MESCO